MKYGIGYKGSKSRIAEDILTVLPGGKRFCDLFGGGFAMSHAAALSGKYEEVLYNDINEIVVGLVRDAIAGKYNPDVFTPRWISREEFKLKRDTDGYIKYCWSFGNNGKEYMYSCENEEEKHCAFDAVCLETITERRLALKKYARRTEGGRIDLPSLESWERLRQLESLKRLPCQCSSFDYREHEWVPGDVVYCDIPYEQDERPEIYRTGFSHEEFYEWARSRPYPVFFSSTYISTEGFKSIWQQERVSTMRSDNNQKTQENLYVQDWYESGGQMELWRDR